jgi:hypothetical protein
VDENHYDVATDPGALAAELRHLTAERNPPTGV